MKTKWTEINEYFSKDIPEQIIAENKDRTMRIEHIENGARDIKTGELSDVFILLELVEI